MLPAMVELEFTICEKAMREVTVDKMMSNICEASNDVDFHLSKHAQLRMSQRSIDLEQIQKVLNYGRMIHSRRARFYVVGKKDTKRLSKNGVNTQGLENMQVLVEEKTNTIVTVYRNKNFRHIRPVLRCERHLHNS